MTETIYFIHNNVTDQIYIGRTGCTTTARWAVHRSDLKHGRHANQYLQADYDKHGADCLDYYEIGEIDAEHAAQVEAWMIKDLGDRAYNIIHRPGLGRQRKYASLTPELLAKAIELLKADWLQADVARRLNIVAPLISQIAVANGLNRRQRGIDRAQINHALTLEQQ